MPSQKPLTSGGGLDGILENRPPSHNNLHNNANDEEGEDHTIALFNSTMSSLTQHFHFQQSSGSGSRAGSPNLQLEPLSRDGLFLLLRSAERNVGVARLRRWLGEFASSTAALSSSSPSSPLHHRGHDPAILVTDNEDDPLSHNTSTSAAPVDVEWQPAVSMHPVANSHAPTVATSTTTRLTQSALGAAKSSSSSANVVHAAPRTTTSRGGVTAVSSQQRRAQLPTGRFTDSSDLRTPNRRPSSQGGAPRGASAASSAGRRASSATRGGGAMTSALRRPASPSASTNRSAVLSGGGEGAMTPVASGMRGGRFAVGASISTPHRSSSSHRKAGSGASSPHNLSAAGHHHLYHDPTDNHPTTLSSAKKHNHSGLGAAAGVGAIDMWCTLTSAASTSRQLGLLTIHPTVRMSFLTELEDVLVSGADDLIKYALNTFDKFSVGATQLLPLLTFQLQSLDTEIILLISRVVGRIAGLMGKLLTASIDSYFARVLWVMDIQSMTSIYQPLSSHVSELVDKVRSPRLLVHLVEHLRWLDGANSSPAGVPALVACCRALRDLNGRCGKDAAPTTYSTSKALCTDLAVRMMDVLVQSDCLNVRFVADDIINPLEYTLPFLDDSMCSDVDCKKGLPEGYLEGLSWYGNPTRACPVALMRYAAYRRAPPPPPPSGMRRASSPSVSQGSHSSPARRSSSPVQYNSSTRRNTRLGGGAVVPGASSPSASAGTQSNPPQLPLTPQEEDLNFHNFIRSEVLVLRTDSLVELEDGSVEYDSGSHPIICAYEGILERAGQEFAALVKTSSSSTTIKPPPTTTTAAAPSNSSAEPSSIGTTNPTTPVTATPSQRGLVGGGTTNDDNHDGDGGSLTAEMMAAVEATASALAATGMFDAGLTHSNTVTATIGTMAPTTSNDTFRHRPRNVNSTATTNNNKSTPNKPYHEFIKNKKSNPLDPDYEEEENGLLSETVTTAATLGGSSTIAGGVGGGDTDTNGGTTTGGIEPFNRRFKQSKERMEFIKCIARAVWDALVLPFIRDYSRPLTASPPTHSVFEMFTMLFPIHAGVFFAESVSSDQRKVLANRLLTSKALQHQYNFPCYMKSIIDEIGAALKSTASATSSSIGGEGGGGSGSSSGNSPVTMSTPTGGIISAGGPSSFASSMIHPNCPMSLLVLSPCTRLGQIYRRHYVGAKGTHAGSVAPTSTSRRSGGGRSVMSISNKSVGGGGSVSHSYIIHPTAPSSAGGRPVPSSAMGDSKGLTGPNLFHMLPAGYDLDNLGKPNSKKQTGSLVALRNPSPRPGGGGGGGGGGRTLSASRHRSKISSGNATNVGSIKGGSRPPSSVASAASSRASSPGATAPSPASPAARPPSALKRTSSASGKPTVTTTTTSTAKKPTVRGTTTQAMPQVSKAKTAGRVVLVRKSTVERVADPHGGQRR